MNEVILAMGANAVENVRALELDLLKLPQINIEINDFLHAGTYTRTAILPAGAVITGVLIKIPTVLIVSGNCLIYVNGEPRELNGYNIFLAEANRKQAFVALSDTYITMNFATNAKTISEAEEQFTDEFECLTTRKERH